MENFEESGTKKELEVEIPFNHPVLVAERKRMKLVSSIICFVGAVLFGALGFLAGGAMLFVAAAFVAFFMAGGLWAVFSTKPNPKKDNVKTVFVFYPGFLHGYRDDSIKQKDIIKCGIGYVPDKQYVNNVIETDKKLVFRVFTGTYNGVPQYVRHVLPKDTLSEEELQALREFLKVQVGEKKYKIKENKKAEF